MTIEESREYLLKRRSPYYNCAADAEANEAIDVAVDTMRKYQKIKHIINDVPYLDKDEYKIASIKEIIAGNDD